MSDILIVVREALYIPWHVCVDVQLQHMQIAHWTKSSSLFEASLSVHLFEFKLNLNSRGVS